MAEFKQNIFDILSPAVAEAQNVLLNDNPMKDQMIAIQKMKNTILSIVDLYGSSRIMDKARLDLKITELNLQLDAAEKLPELQGQPKEDQEFKAYLEKVETFINLMQKIRHKNTYSDEDYDALYGYGLSII